ncbi:MAG TPA: lactate utilization protein, partial [Rhizobiales bacterium]|nr:lactate utilization protein [Hyphomicrobiales bacterium]
MLPGTQNFPQNARKALDDAALQKALGNVKRGFIAKRARARAALPEFEALRDEARDIKIQTLANLDLYLECYEEQVKAAGGHVHWARDAGEAQQIIAKICKDAGA